MVRGQTRSELQCAGCCQLLSGSVCAYRKETVKPRFIRIDEVMALLDVTQDEAMDIALAAGARYQLAKIILVHKETESFGRSTTENHSGRDKQVPAVKDCRFTQTAFGTVVHDSSGKWLGQYETEDAAVEMLREMTKDNGGYSDEI